MDRRIGDGLVGEMVDKRIIRWMDASMDGRTETSVLLERTSLCFNSSRPIHALVCHLIHSSVKGKRVKLSL
jgi:hypothetical protein